MSDLVERFRRYAEQAQARDPVAEPPTSGPLPAGFDVCAGPGGAVPLRVVRRPFPEAPVLGSGWPSRLAGSDLGPVDGWRFMDLETTGLGAGAGNRAFLVGVGMVAAGELVIRQYLLEDLDRERALLAACLETLAGATALVTFNGKAFDWPLFRDRCRLAGLPEVPALAHWDVLHAVRRIFAPEMGACDLRRLESHLLAAPRGPDVQGAEIPALYGAWLNGDGAALTAVVRHHLEDVWALAGVAAAVARALAQGPDAAWPTARLWGLGRTYEALGASAQALAAYAAARRGGQRAAAGAAARLLKRLGRADEALALWEAERRGPVPSLEAAVEVAKDLEHRQRAPAAALQVVLAAVPLAAAVGSERQLALRHRLERLQRKVGGAGTVAGKGG